MRIPELPLPDRSTEDLREEPRLEALPAVEGQEREREGARPVCKT